jgi:hypothetical protein
VSLKLYLISLDLQAGKSLEAEYSDVCSHLRELRAEQVLQNQWALRSGFTAKQLRDRFRRFIIDTDRITVVEVGEERASRRAMADIKKL